MKRIFRIEGIVLRRRNFNETDKILTIYTKRFGKKTVIAKGIRKISSRKAPHLELFTYIKATLAKGKTWDIITEVETLKSFSEFRKNLQKIAFAYKIVEVVDRFCQENQKQEKILEMLVDIFGKLNMKNLTDVEKEIDRFYSRLLWELGYLEREKYMFGPPLENYLESIMEKGIKSKSLIEKISS